MKKFLLIFLLIFFNNYFAQEYVFGKVITEQNTEVSGVLVINIRTEEETYTNKDGNFMIAAKNNDLIRFVKQKFDRVSYQLNPKDFEKPLTINMQKSAIEIDKIEIKNKLTGNLKTDISKFENKKKSKLNSEINKMNLENTDIKILLPKAGEFSQPKGEGFSIGAVSNKWDNVDISESYLYILGESYFENFRLKKDEITPFIFYIMESIDLKDSRKKGYLKSEDIAKFQVLAEKKIKTFKKLKQS